jgi:hypothetical protein
MEEAMNTPREFGPKGGICGSPMPEQGDPQVDTSYTGIIAQQAETIANLRTALETKDEKAEWNARGEHHNGRMP